MRWAGGGRGGNAPRPDAEVFIEDQISLIESSGMSHAVWKWDPQECLGDDDFNFRNGQIFNSHKNVSSELYGKITLSWERNEIFPNEVKDKF